MAGIGKWSAALLGLPGEYGGGGSAVTFEEGWAVTVCPCAALRGYTGSIVELETEKGFLTVEGEGLTLKSFHGDVMEVRGRVSGMKYREKRKEKKA